MTRIGVTDANDWPTNGWQVATPADLGLDGGRLDDADRYVRAELPGAYGLLVVRHGRIAYERYYQGYGVQDAFAVQSVTKSVTSALVGIATGDGALSGVDARIGELLPERVPNAADPRTQDITVAHVLAMTAGFAWDDFEDYWRMTQASDWVRAVLARPLAHEPGTTFTYNSGASQLLTTIVAATTGRPVAELAASRLFGPLGIVPKAWPTDPLGVPTGGAGLEMTSRDLAKFGLLYLNGGRREGAQIVPAFFVADSTRRQSGGGDPEPDRTTYGYHWWLTEVAGHGAFFASGYGGQYVYVVPALDLVVVTAARSNVPPPETMEMRPVIEEFVVPAVRR